MRPDRKLLRCRPGVARLWVLFLFFTLLLHSFVIYMAALHPIFGWDVLSYWGPRASSILAGAPTFIDEAGERHSWATPALLAVIFKLQDYIGSSARVAFWIALFFAVFAVGIIAGVKKRLKFAWLVMGLTITIPLVENHLIIIGYADLLVGAASAVFLTALSAFFFDKQTLRMLTLVLGAGCLLILLRNTGWAVMLLGVLSVFLVGFFSTFGLVRALRILAITSGFVAAIGYAWSESFTVRDVILVSQNEDLVKLEFPRCDGAQKFDRVLIRPMDQDRKDLRALSGVRQVQAFTNLDWPGEECGLVEVGVDERATILVIEAYDEYDNLLFWRDFYVDTRLVSVAGIFEIGFGKSNWVTAFGWKMELSYNGVRPALMNFAQAVFLIASFSILFTVAILLTAYLANSTAQTSLVTSTHLLNFWMLVVAYVVAQVVFERPATISHFSTDTFGSRFLISTVIHFTIVLGFTMLQEHGAHDRDEMIK